MIFTYLEYYKMVENQMKNISKWEHLKQRHFNTLCGLYLAACLFLYFLFRITAYSEQYSGIDDLVYCKQCYCEQCPLVAGNATFGLCGGHEMCVETSFYCSVPFKTKNLGVFLSIPGQI